LLLVAEVVKKGVNSLNEDIRTPNYSDIKDSSWQGVSDFVFIPKETVMNATGIVGLHVLLARTNYSQVKMFSVGHNDAHSLHAYS